jgi:hypothetical protein
MTIMWQLFCQDSNTISIWNEVYTCSSISLHQYPPKDASNTSCERINTELQREHVDLLPVQRPDPTSDDSTTDPLLFSPSHNTLAVCKVGC